MGSVVSFPVLCIANLALTLLAFRLSGRPRPAHRCHILINGDDIGFAALPEQVTAWQRVTSLFGLEPSVGKNFINPRAIQLNSKVFEYDSGRFAPIPSPSLAVLLVGSDSNGALGNGLNRVISFPEFLGSASQWQRFFLSTVSTPNDRMWLNFLWTGYWSASLSVVSEAGCGTINWYFPRSLGGLGLQWHGFGLPRANEGQLRAAAYRRDMSDYTSWSDSIRSVGLTEKVNDMHDVCGRLLRTLSGVGLLVRRWRAVDSEDLSTLAPFFELGNLQYSVDHGPGLTRLMMSILAVDGCMRTNFRAGSFRFEDGRFSFDHTSPLLLSAERILRPLVKLNQLAASRTPRVMDVTEVLSFPEFETLWVPAPGINLILHDGLTCDINTDFGPQWPIMSVPERLGVPVIEGYPILLSPRR
jgi:hypothetical protein